MIVDAHSHALHGDAVVGRSPADVLPAGYIYSVGVHPWVADTFDAAQLEAAARRPEVVAIGETGLDRRRGPEMELQERVFRAHMELSERLGKPLIIHCVKAVDRLLALRKEWRPKCDWIFHGFRGKPATAAQLTEAGLYVSVGQRFNAAAVASIAADRLLIETDEATVGIAAVARSVASVRGCSADELATICAGNLARCLARQKT